LPRSSRRGPKIRRLPPRGKGKSVWINNIEAIPQKSRTELPEGDRLLLEERLADIAEAEWKREAVVARRIARERGLDQMAIDQAVHDVRYPS
jgi:hypothetical protein